MKTFSHKCVLSALVFCAGLLSLQAAENPSAAFVNVTVIPMDRERVVPGQTVLIQGDRIQAIGPAGSVQIPEGATRIDGAGKFLIPGLGEMHGHNPPPDAPREFVETVYFLFLANGVTTVRSMLGWPGQLELREKVIQGEVIGPTLYLAGPSFSGATVRSPAQAEEKVREQHEEGWDLLKVHPGLTRQNYDAMARTARELEMEFSGHIPADVGLFHAIERGQRTVDHLDGYIEYLNGAAGPLDPAKLEQAVIMTREADVAVVPTMVLWETIIGAADLEQMTQFPELKYMPPREVERWKANYQRRTQSSQFNRDRARQIAQNRKVLLKALHEGGVHIIFGTDAPQEFSVPGFSIHREAEAMREAGLSPYVILETATRKVGEYLKDKDDFGTIAPGLRADLILLEANPLEDIGNLQKRAGVMARGEWLPESEIKKRLEEIAHSYQRGGVSDQ